MSFHTTDHFGDPLWVFLQYTRRRGDQRPEQKILADGREQLDAVRKRGVFIAQGHGSQSWELQPALKADMHRIYDDAKQSIWTELDDDFVDRIPNALPLTTRSEDRLDYILHPESGEQPATTSTATLRALRNRHAGQFDVQIVVSDGLNALAIMDDGHLAPFLTRLRKELTKLGLRAAPEHIVMTSGRVRCGYRIGETLFSGLQGHRAIMHIIGERPGTGHHTFSNYMTAPTADVWSVAGKVDHNITKVVSGIATTALDPIEGADESARILKTLM